MKKTIFTLTILLILTFTSVYSQQRTLLGVDFTNDIVDGDLRPGFGLNLTRSFSKRSSLEVGVYYRNYIEGMRFYAMNKNYQINILESYLSIPITYRFSFKYFYVSGGPSFDTFLNWKQQTESDFTITSYDRDPKYNLGLLFKTGTEIKLSDKLIFAPELRFNPILTSERTYFGLGLNLKYDLNKN
ncbi:MAG: hypothetical protein PF541_00365 [Prolixibacteraceae bacterium]|jgi:hypothetical protein|nr:hypothetical protein [Prolixibacteraceae bacterium]